MRPFITCRQLIDCIGDYVAGELNDLARFELERHLQRCPSCRAYLDSYRQVQSILASLTG